MTPYGLVCSYHRMCGACRFPLYGRRHGIMHKLKVRYQYHKTNTFCQRTRRRKRIRCNSNKSQTRCNNFTVYYPGVYLQLNMFRAFSAHHQELSDCSGSLWFYLRIMVIVVLCSWSGLPAGGYHNDTKVKPEAATAVIELLMMGGKTTETC